MAGIKDDKGGGPTSLSRFDNMSDQELRDYLGGDVDPNLTRSELIVKATNADAGERGNMPK